MGLNFLLKMGAVSALASFVLSPAWGAANWTGVAGPTNKVGGVVITVSNVLEAVTGDTAAVIQGNGDQPPPKGGVKPPKKTKAQKRREKNELAAALRKQKVLTVEQARLNSDRVATEFARTAEALGPSFTDACLSDKSIFVKTEINKYLKDALHIEDVTTYNATLKRLCQLERAMKTIDGSVQGPEALLAAVKLILEEDFPPNSAGNIREILDALRQSQSNNPVLLGPPGVGKTFLIKHLISLLSFGVVPEFLKSAVGLNTAETDFFADVDSLKKFREGFLEKTQVIKITPAFFVNDNTKEGAAWAAAEDRVASIVPDLFAAAEKDFRNKGIRTVFVFDEIRTFRTKAIEPFLGYLDTNGFVTENDPVKREEDPGYSVIAITTAREWQQLLSDIPAMDRRFVRVNVEEPTEEEAVALLDKQVRKWLAGRSDGLKVGPEILKYIVKMRRMFKNPSLAMPDSILKQTDVLLNWAASQEKIRKRPGHEGEITRDDVWEFLVRQAKLPLDVWAPYAATVPVEADALYDLAERVKKEGVVGQDEAIERIARVIQRAAMNGFQETPVIIVGGPSGSGKNTLVRAFNRVLFGHDGLDFLFRLDDDTYRSVLEKGEDNELPAMIRALRGAQRPGAILGDEVMDLGSENMKKLKEVTEQGRIVPRSGDGVPRKFGINILFLAGEYGEKLFAGKSDEEIRRIYAGLTDQQIRDIFMHGADGEKGAMTRSLIDRAVLHGAMVLLKPVERPLYPEIVRPKVAKIIRARKDLNNATVVVEDSLIEMISRTAAEGMKSGPRGLEGITFQFIDGAISVASSASENRLRLSNSTLHLRASPDGASVEIEDATPGRKLQKYTVRLTQLMRSEDGAHCEAMLRK